MTTITKISIFGPKRRQQNNNISSNLFKQTFFLLLILNYAVAKMKRFDADICECGSRCVGFGAKHCVRCCTTVMRRSVPISEYPMEQLKDAAVINNKATSTEEEKQQNELIEKFLENNNEQKKTTTTNSRLEKRRSQDNIQTFIPSILLDQAYFLMEDKNGQITRRRTKRSLTAEKRNNLKQLQQRLTTGKKTNF